MRPEEVWEGSGAKERAVRALATPLSWLYALGWQAYKTSYAVGLKRPSEPHRPIICIGSLVVGGSGKSPLTMHLAQVLKGLGKQVVIGCSGYGAPHSKLAEMAPAGPLKASEWGDEPAMFRWLLPDVPLVVGRRRVLAAELVHQQYAQAVLVMDDGFQHLPIKKKRTILLDNPSPTNTLTLPAGPYREPRRNRNRADLIIPGEFEIVRSPMRIVTPDGKAASPAEYGVLCALGQPDKFLRSLAEAFPNALSKTPTALLPDHDPLTAPGIWDSIAASLPIVVTAKDWVKLRERADVSLRTFLIALQDVRVEPKGPFKAWLQESCDE